MSTDKKVSNNLKVVTVKRVDEFLQAITNLQEDGYLLEDYLIIDLEDDGVHTPMIVNAKLYFKKAQPQQSMSNSVKKKFNEIEVDTTYLQDRVGILEGFIGTILRNFKYHNEKDVTKEIDKWNEKNRDTILLYNERRSNR